MACTKTGSKNDLFLNCRRKPKELSKKELSNVAPASKIRWRFISTSNQHVFIFIVVKTAKCDLILKENITLKSNGKCFEPTRFGSASNYALHVTQWFLLYDLLCINKIQTFILYCNSSVSLFFLKVNCEKFPEWRRLTM